MKTARMKILVAYATKCGSTKSIAEYMSSRLSTNFNIATVAVPVGEVQEIDSFDAAIIGSAIRAGSWIRPARRFVSSNADALSKRPVWAFSVGLPSSPQMANKESDTIRKRLEQSIALKDHTLLEGYWRIEDWGFIMRWFAKCVGLRSADRRNWGAVDTFVDGIVGELNRSLSSLDAPAR